MGEPARTERERLARALLRAELEELVVENAYLLDRGLFAELVELYTDDCEVVRPLPPFDGERQETIRGRLALRAWYAGPAWPRTPRTMRHVVSNLRVGDVNEHRVTATLTLLGYRYEGAGVSVAKPMMVGDYEDEYRRGADGSFRIHRRRVVIGFLNQELLDAAAAGAQSG